MEVLALQSFLRVDCLERRQPVKGKPLRGGMKLRNETSE
jgi:hypothetical protein